MPSGKAHETIGIAVLASMSPVILFSDIVPVEAKIPMIGGLAWGILLTPD